MSGLGSLRSGPLGVRSFRLLAGGQFTSTIGDYCYAVALPWLVLSNRGGVILLGIVLACYGVPRTVLIPVGVSPGTREAGCGVRPRYVRRKRKRPQRGAAGTSVRRDDAIRQQRTLRQQRAHANKRPTGGRHRDERPRASSGRRVVLLGVPPASSRVPRASGRPSGGCRWCRTPRSFPRRAGHPGCAGSRGRWSPRGGHSRRTGSCPGASAPPWSAGPGCGKERGRSGSAGSPTASPGRPSPRAGPRPPRRRGQPRLCRRARGTRLYGDR